MGLSLSNIVRGIAPVAQVAGNIVQGANIDRENAIKRTLADAAAKRQADNDAIRNTLTVAQTNKLTAPPSHEYKVDNGQRIDVTAGTAMPIEGYVAPTKAPEYKVENGQRIDVNAGTAEPIKGYTPPEPAAPNLIVTDIGGTATEPGKKVAVNPKTGQIVTEVGDAKAPTAGAGSAKMMQAVAANDAMVKNIDDAIAAVRANPNSFGLEHGRGLPFVGGFLDQRMDPTGTGPRAQVANIGSQKLHDRSGAAVTAAEFPRLQPFIPSSQDDAQSIITKLEQMRKVVQNENETMRSAGAPAHAAPSTQAKPPGAGDAEFDALMAKYRRPPT